jgi:hypothetical protein
MAFRHGKNTVIWLNSSDISPYFNEVSSSQKAEPGDTTAFGAGAKTYVMGLSEGSISLKGLWDGAVNAVDSQLSAAVGVDPDQICTYGIEGAVVGGQAKLFAGDETDYQLTTPVTDVVSITASIQATGSIDAGKLLAANASLTTTTNGVSVDNVVASVNGGVAHLHITANTRSTATVVKIQHSADNSTWVDLVTFASVATGAMTNERNVVNPGTTVNRYIRVLTTPAAGTGAVTVTAAFARR